jgi:hypothetical protein
MRHFSRVLIIVLFSTVVTWSQPVAAPARLPGCLTSAQTSEVIRIVPPAPMTGDPRFQADMAIFHATRRSKGRRAGHSRNRMTIFLSPVCSMRSAVRWALH